MSTDVEEIFREVNELPPQEQERLIALLEAQRRADEGHLTLEHLAAEQGTMPLRFEQLLGAPAPDEEDDLKCINIGALVTGRHAWNRIAQLTQTIDPKTQTKHLFSPQVC